MNLEVNARALAQSQRLGLVDCDIHPRFRSIEDYKPFMSARWWEYWMTYGARRRQGLARGHNYPKAQPADGMRRDAWAPDGSVPGSSLDFMRKQYLDPYGVQYGIMNPLGPGQGDQNREFSAAICFAINEWQLETFSRKEPRLKASIVVPYEDPQLAVREIRQRAGDPHFAHVLLLSRTPEALGRPRYWPIYEAAVEANLPIGIHVFGTTGWASSNTGWMSYYIEEMAEHGASSSALIASMVIEGLFERFPTLKVVMIEAGFAWLPSLGWRMDKHWKKMRAEVPHLRRAPSEYIRENVWVTTQPIEAPEKHRHLIELMDWIGYDRIMFASDYPHWDFDDPEVAIPASLGDARRGRILSENAKALYGFA